MEHEFEVWIDHKNLEYFMSAKKLNQRQTCWLLVLTWFDFTLYHHLGKSMGKLDTLSRRVDHSSRVDDKHYPLDP